MDYALEFKRKACSIVSAYPPRIVFSFCQLDPNVDTSIECRIGVSGIQGVSSYDLHVPPISSSETSSQRGILS